MKSFLLQAPRLRSYYLGLEFCLVFIGLPSLLAAFHAQRPVIYVSLWVMAMCAVWVLKGNYSVCWHHLWHGNGWPAGQQRQALTRFILVTIIIATWMYLAYPAHLFEFPRQRPQSWLLVMLFYPLGSVLAQEFVLLGVLPADGFCSAGPATVYHYGHQRAAQCHW